MVCQCLENPGLKPTIAQNSIMNMLPKSPVNHLHEEIHIKEEHLIKDEFESSTESSNFSTHLESSTIKDLFCEQCKLQFDKKIVYDIHLKIVHKKDTIVPIETRCKPVNDTSTVHEESNSKSSTSKQEIVKSSVSIGNVNAVIIEQLPRLPTEPLPKALIEKEIETSNCTLCDACFLYKIDLAMHIASTHKANKQFKCTLCNYKTTRKYILREHIKSNHEGKKPFKNICDYSFSQRSYMNRHVESVHEGKKPFKCDICDYSFSPESHENTFKCEICNYCCFLTKQMNQQG